MWILILLLSFAQGSFAQGETSSEKKVNPSFQPIEEAESLKEAAKDSAATSVSGIVRIVRGSPETEVFFKDLKNSLIIPKDSQHNKILEACEESRKKGTPVHLKIDPKSRRILGLPAAAKPAKGESSKPSDPGAS
jgi:hypothetical protein